MVRKGLTTMKVFVVHDVKGNIRSFGVSGAQLQEDVTLENARGWVVSEVDVPPPGGPTVQDAFAQLRHLEETLKRHRVKRSRGSATLAPRGRARRE
jgi:hypothetical protein